MNNKYSVACITLVRDKYKINTDAVRQTVLRLAWYIRPIRCENSIRNRIGRPIRFERKKTIRKSLCFTLCELRDTDSHIDLLSYCRPNRFFFKYVECRLRKVALASIASVTCYVQFWGIFVLDVSVSVLLLVFFSNTSHCLYLNIHVYMLMTLDSC